MDFKVSIYVIMGKYLPIFFIPQPPSLILDSIKALVMTCFSYTFTFALVYNSNLRPTAVC